MVNLGIKQPIAAIIEAAEQHDADAIGMSGLLVKSTLVMRDNLLELNARGLAGRFPVLLGGAALTRTFVDHDLAERFDGTVRYAKDAFEGLELMDAITAVKRGEPGAELPPVRPRRVTAKTRELPELTEITRSDVARRIAVPAPPFWGTRVTKGIKLAEITDWLDEKALFAGRWGLRGVRGGASYEELVETEGRPRLRGLLDRSRPTGWASSGSCTATSHAIRRGTRWWWGTPTILAARSSGSTSRGNRETGDCAWPTSSGTPRRPRISARTPWPCNWSPWARGCRRRPVGCMPRTRTGTTWNCTACRQLTEALAEMWHHRVRAELGIAGDEGSVDAQIADQAYRGSRYSFGYPACPDLEMRAPLCELLQPGRIGVELSEEFQLHPEQSTDALVVHHPEAKYFNAR